MVLSEAQPGCVAVWGWVVLKFRQELNEGRLRCVDFLLKYFCLF